jgi:hypothetical protein
MSVSGRALLYNRFVLFDMNQRFILAGWESVNDKGFQGIGKYLR